MKELLPGAVASIQALWLKNPGVATGLRERRWKEKCMGSAKKKEISNNTNRRHLKGEGVSFGEKNQSSETAVKGGKTIRVREKG